MFHLRSALSIIFLIVVISCKNSRPNLEGVDIEKWKADKHGCGGQRTAMGELIQTQRAKLQGLSEMEIIDVLGRPDQNELYSRNQKFYYYDLEPGKGCGKDIKVKRLSVRFNATGMAKEIAIE